MTNDLPGWLLEGRDGDVRPQVPQYLPLGEPVPGVIGRVLPMDRTGSLARLVVVVQRDRAAGALQVALLTNELELGSDRDLLVLPSESRLPFPVLLETDVFSYVWEVQVEVLDASVSQQTLRACRNAMAGEELDDPAGPANLDRRDSRWGHKKLELSQLMSLSSGCTTQLLNGEVSTVLIESALEAPEPEELEDVWEFVDYLDREVRSGALQLPLWFYSERFCSNEYAAAWRKSGAYAVYDALQKLLFDHMLLMGVETRSIGFSGSRPSGSSDVRPDGQILGELEMGRTSVNVVQRAPLGHAPRATLAQFPHGSIQVLMRDFRQTMEETGD